MFEMTSMWNLTIIDGDPPVGESASALAVGDVDGDGSTEIIVGGDLGLVWYRPKTGERGVIDSARIAVGLTVADVDGDGRLEVVAAAYVEPHYRIVWYKAPKDPGETWARYILDPEKNGGVHDILFADIDGDGVDELIAADPYGGMESIYVYRRPADASASWAKHIVQKGQLLEGLSVGDFNGDGRIEILCGPDMFVPPEEGPYAGDWRRTTVAPSFREMSRTAAVDITGNGRPDIVIAESEYLKGALSWFENRLLEDPVHPWREHRLEEDLYYTHSLKAWRDGDGVHIFAAEMWQGGWDGPPNYEGRMLELTSTDNGARWSRELLYKGEGTHQATIVDLDGSDRKVVVGKRWGSAEHNPQVHVLRRASRRSPLLEYRHRFLDRAKPHRASDIFSADVTGNGRPDVICGSRWYRNPDWQPFDIPDIYQGILAYDIDGDGRQEIIASTGPRPAEYPLSSRLVWLKPIDPQAGKWEQHSIGTGAGDWPHGALVAPVLPGGRLALVCAYHSAKKQDHFPDIFEIPEDPRHGPWPRRTLVEWNFGEQMGAADLTGSGTTDLLLGTRWLENLGNGEFVPHTIVEGFESARLTPADLNGDGRLDVVMTEENQQWFEDDHSGWGHLLWFEQPEDPRQSWIRHSIDKMRMPHSLGVADLDGDGRLEIVACEHDPFRREYHSQCRVFVYEPVNADSTVWTRHRLDNRFEHHDGAHVFEIEPGRPAIVSHGWKDYKYVHMWTTD